MVDLTETLQKFAQEHLAENKEHFLITIERSSKNATRYAVIIDGDKGVSIDYCAQLSRHISKRVDEELGDDISAFTYEVASPGVDRPLKTERQYPKHIGREIFFTDFEGKPVKGKLLSVENGQIEVSVETQEKGKKKETIGTQTFAIANIIEPKILVSFK